MTLPASPLPLAVRAWAERTADRHDEKRPSRRANPTVRYVLVVDTETTVDVAQALTFGCYRFGRISADGLLECLEEGLFYADELPERDPDGYQTLRRYVYGDGTDDQHRADVAPIGDAAPRLHLYSRREFSKKVLWRAGYELKATIVMFNAPFDLSRLAIRSAPARGMFEGGFSLQIWDDDYNRPRVAYKTIDSKRALKAFRSRGPIEGIDGDTDDNERRFRGHLLDLRTLVFALTNESQTLATACDAFDVDHGKQHTERHGHIGEAYIDYCRRDVLATSELYERAMAEYARHPIDLQATKAYSPASMAKAYLEEMGIVPILERQPDFPRDVLGYAMTSFYGGRAECHIRRVPLPVTVVDFTSMYPTVDTLMGLWDILTAEHVNILDATDHIQGLLNRITLDNCFDPAQWPDLVGIAQLVPDGDILPVRAHYSDGPGWNIGVNPLHAAEPMWFSVPDLVASKLLTGRTPRIVKALRVVATGKQLGLRPVALRGELAVDPTKADFFRVVIEERQRTKARLPPTRETDRLEAFLKVLGNAGSYGIFAEMIRHDLPPSQRESVTVYGLDAEPFTYEVAAPESPGRWCFPPIAAAITGAARLMLAMVERCVTDAGGTWVFCDTDSMAIVATPTGGLLPCAGGAERLDGSPAVRALSHAEVDEIRARFERFNPYDPALAADLLKIEKRDVECFAISAKRYALFRRTGSDTIDQLGDDEEVGGSGIESDKKSEHGLGHLLNPIDPDSDDRDWIREAWTWLLRQELGLLSTEPAWLNQPALTRVTVSSQTLMKPFADWNSGKTYADQIKPANFLVVAHADPLRNPGIDLRRFRLIAPFESNSTKWSQLPWRNLYDPNGPTYTLASNTDAEAMMSGIVVKTYGDVLGEYRAHPESTFLDADGHVCGRRTIGVLQRGPVHAASIAYIGKEANRLDDVESGLVADLDDVLTEYVDPRCDLFRTVVLRSLDRLSVRDVARLINEHAAEVTAEIDRRVRRVRRDAAATSRRLGWKASTIEREVRKADAAARAAAIAQLGKPTTITERTVRRIRNGDAPRADHRKALAELAGRLRPAPLMSCAVRDKPHCNFPGCTERLSGRQRIWCPVHRKHSGVARRLMRTSN
jgi:hypothetical protein